jgi:hypothetical protein
MKAPWRQMWQHPAFEAFAFVLIWFCKCQCHHRFSQPCTMEAGMCLWFVAFLFLFCFPFRSL